MATQEIDPKHFQGALVIQPDTKHKLLHLEEQEQPSSILPSATSSPDDDEKSKCGDCQYSNYSSEDIKPPAQSKVIKTEELMKIPGAIVRIKTIDADKKPAMEELASGDLCISLDSHDDKTISCLARVSDKLWWRLSKDQQVAKLGDSLYEFSVRVSTSTKGQASEDISSSDKEEERKDVKSGDSCSEHEATSTHGGGDELKKTYLWDLSGVIEREEEYLLMELDEILKACSHFSEADVEDDSEQEEEEEEEGNTLGDTTEGGESRRSSSGGNFIARFSDSIAKRIERSADKTENKLKRVEELMTKRSMPQSKVTQTTRRRMKRIKNMTRLTEKTVNGTLTGMIKVSDFVTNIIEGPKASTLLDKVPGGQIIKETVKGSNKVTHAVGEAGKRIMSRSTDLSTRLAFNRQDGQLLPEAGKYPTSAESSKSDVRSVFI